MCHHGSHSMHHSFMQKNGFGCADGKWRQQAYFHHHTTQLLRRFFYSPSHTLWYTLSLSHTHTHTHTHTHFFFLSLLFTYSLSLSFLSFISLPLSLSLSIFYSAHFLIHTHSISFFFYLSTSAFSLYTHQSIRRVLEYHLLDEDPSLACHAVVSLSDSLHMCVLQTIQKIRDTLRGRVATVSRDIFKDINSPQKGGT